MFVVTQYLTTARSMFGGGGSGGADEEKEPEPMEVICYRLDLEGVLANGGFGR